MNKQLLSITLLYGVHLCLLFGAKQPETPVDATIDTIPQMCVNIMVQLLAQEPKELYNETCCEFQYKLLPTQCINDCKICAWINSLSKFRYNLDIDVGVFHNTESSEYFEAIRIWLPQRGMIAHDEVEKFIQARPVKHSPELVATLLREYERVIEHVKNGWTQSNTKYYDKIKPPDGENWVHFIKDECVINEAKFITELVKKFNFAERVYCRGINYMTYKERVHFWIDKNALQEFGRILKFKTPTGHLLCEKG